MILKYKLFFSLHCCFCYFCCLLFYFFHFKTIKKIRSQCFSIHCLVFVIFVFYFPLSARQTAKLLFKISFTYQQSSYVHTNERLFNKRYKNTYIDMHIYVCRYICVYVYIVILLIVPLSLIIEAYNFFFIFFFLSSAAFFFERLFFV